MSYQLTTPVAFIIFSRPGDAQRVFNEIKKARPRQLFVIADGPRNGGERARCDEARAIINQVDWNCEIYKNYSEVNLGCRKRVSSGIDWVFTQVDRAIILEDDCLPHPTFFSYCEELLERYENDARIMQIAGVNFQAGNKNFQCEASYYFSTISQIWGWATWRRAWKHYDVDMKSWPLIKERGTLKTVLGDDAAVYYWEDLLQRIYEKKGSKVDTWDAQWVLACWVHNGLSVMPRVNLISNIGFGADATRTMDTMDEKANLRIEAIDTPLIHSKTVNVNKVADEYTLRYVFGINRTMSKKIKWHFKSRFPKAYGLLKKIYYGS